MASQIDVKKLLEHCGGITQVHTDFERVGIKIQRQAIQKWSDRNSIPGGHLVRLIEIAKKKKKSINILQFTNNDNS